MRIFLLLTTVCLFEISAISYSQEKQFDLKIQGSIGEVLKSIESKSEFRFFYNESEVDITRNVFVNVEDQKINVILDQILAGTGTKYEIYDRYILLHPKEMMQQGQLNNQLNTRWQPVTITGTVTDNSGATLPGVNIAIKGTNRGVISDNNGSYSLDVASGSDVLVFSYVGYITEEIAIGAQSIINVTLEEDYLNIEEVVVVGYGVV